MAILIAMFGRKTDNYGYDSIIIAYPKPNIKK